MSSFAVLRSTSASGDWLASSEELVRALTAASPVGAFISAADGACVYVNQRWCELAGMSAGEALGDGWSRALHPDDRERILREWSDSSHDVRDSVVEYRFVRPDGSVVWIEGRASPLRGDDGQLLGWAGSCVDVTARHRRERQQQLALAFGLRAVSASKRADLRRDAVDTLASGVGADYASFQQPGADGRLVMREGYGWKESPPPGTASPNSPAGRALASSGAVLINRASGQCVEFLQAHGVEASVAAAVPGDGLTVGVLSAHSTRPDAFSDDDLYFVSAVANSLSAALLRAESTRSVRRLAAIVDSSHEAIIGRTPEGFVTSWNAAAERLFGYSAVEMIGGSVEGLLADSAVFPEMNARLLRGERVDGRCVSARRKDGSELQLELTLSPVTDDKGMVVGVSTIARDIGERLRAEEKLRRSEARYRDLFENAGDLIATADLSGRLTRVNAAFAQALDYTESELIGRVVTDLVPEEWHSRLEGARDQKLELDSGTTVYEHELIARSGDRIPVEVVSRLVLEDGRPIEIEAVCRDLRERRRAERALRASEERFRALFEFSPKGMDITDRLGTIVEANDALARLLGYERHELLGRSFAEFTHPDDLNADLDLYRELVNGDRESYELEKRYIRADGATVTVHLTAFAIVTETGGPRRLMAIVDDVSAQRALEEQLRQSQKMEAIGRLAGGIAHDFNNLLTGISGFAELGLGALTERDANGPLERALTGIGQAADQAEALTSQLLAFSRRQILKPQLVPINALARDFVPLLERLLGETVAIELALDEAVGSVKADPAQLRQVLMNLAVNARDAMPEGGTLTIETEHAELESAPTTQGPVSGRFVLLAVSDTGTGMAPETLERIFEPFYTTKGPSSGTGLGLATVIGIVEQSGGRISVYSEPGIGSTFKIYLPRQEDGDADDPAVAQKHDAKSGTERLLLVEDNEHVRAFTAAALESLGYAVTSCPTPSEALAAIGDGLAVDAVLSDLVMPELDGRELVAQLLLGRPTLGVVLMSGYTDDAIAARGVADDNMIFLQKPFTVAQLGDAIRQALERRS